MQHLQNHFKNPYIDYNRQNTPILSIIIDKITIFTPIIIDTMDKTLIKRLIVEYQRLPQEINFIKRDIALSNNLNYVLVGLRRSGKSYLLYQKIND